MTPPLLAPRYRLITPLGEGGMGAVFRAHDRLTGHTVALKCVALAQDLSGEEIAELRLALAHEFRTLASLRHPHIISVLDYGFDALRRPFFTMELLDGARTILDAGRALSLDARTDLLLQALEALAYLHRRGVIHHDLKPENILVTPDGRLRLLDFGLAVLADQQRESDSFGTLRYLAPEVLDAQPYVEAADLYSLGVIAYELLAGRHPFPAETVRDFLDQVFTAAIDMAAIPGPPALAALLGQLMARDPVDRPASAQAAIESLRAALGLPPEESLTIRESYLQAASFVGRERELALLTDALAAARGGEGSAWLVGGESGVGKSRLLDELRTHALVEGFTVLHGQGVEDGGTTYQIWREPLRALVLTTALSDLEAGVLAPIVPDIATLLGREIPDAPALSGAESSQRLLRVILDLLARQGQPLALILEDLQWADASLLLLQEVVRLLGPTAILIAGSYRDDERPDMPAALPQMRLITLPRLSAASIAALSAAMLGESGRQQGVLALLERETEGNAFFMVEVVRALAEGAGALADVGSVTLPAHVLTGGVLRLVERRLQRVPAVDLPRLQLAAVLGRHVDLASLGAAGPGEPLDGWLLACAERQVLEIHGEQWRFSHDKVREGVLLNLAPERRRELHHQAALAIEGAYDDLAPEAARLAEHFRHAGLPERERAAARQAGDYAVRLFAHAEAARHYSRALALTDAPGERFDLLLAREEIHNWRGDRAAQSDDLRALAALAEALGDDRLRLTAAMRQVRQVLALRDFPTVIAQTQQTLALARALGDIEAEATALLRWGVAHHRQHEFPEASALLGQALALARRHGLGALIIDSLLNLGMIADLAGDLADARALLGEALERSQAIGDRQREATALNALSVNASRRGDQAARDRALEQALLLARMVGRPDVECVVLTNMGISALVNGDYDRAEQLFDQTLPLTRLIGDRLTECYILGEYGKLERALGDIPAAQRSYERALARGRELGVRDVECQLLGELSLAAQELGDLALAEAYVRESLQIAEAAGLANEMQMAWLGLGTILLLGDAPARAAEAFQTMLALAEGQDVLAESVAGWLGMAQASLALGGVAEATAYVSRALVWIELHAPSEMIDIIGAYLVCYRVLDAAGDPRAAAMLAAGHRELQRQAALIGDLQRRQRFLAGTRAHREILAAWDARA